MNHLSSSLIVLVFGFFCWKFLATYVSRTTRKMIPKKSPAKWGSPASSHIADSDSGGLAVKLDKLIIREVDLGDSGPAGSFIEGFW